MNDDRGGGIAASRSLAPQPDCGGRIERPRLVFAHPNDRGQFSDLICLVREQLEVFVEPPKTTNKKKKKVSAEDQSRGERRVSEGGVPLDLCAKDRVGIRCVHCQGRGKVSGSLRGAVMYPTSTHLVYQSVRNYQRYHMMGCPLLPVGVRDRIVEIKEATWQKRSINRTGAHWEKTCARMGLVNAEDGQLRLRKAVLDGTWTVEMGNAAMQRVDEVVAKRDEDKSGTTKTRATSSEKSPGVDNDEKSSISQHNKTKSVNDTTDDSLPQGLTGAVCQANGENNEGLMQETYSLGGTGEKPHTEHGETFEDLDTLFDVEPSAELGPGATLSVQGIKLSNLSTEILQMSERPAMVAIECCGNDIGGGQQPRIQQKRNLTVLSDDDCQLTQRSIFASLESSGCDRESHEPSSLGGGLPNAERTSTFQAVPSGIQGQGSGITTDALGLQQCHSEATNPTDGSVNFAPTISVDNSSAAECSTSLLGLELRGDASSANSGLGPEIDTSNLSAIQEASSAGIGHDSILLQSFEKQQNDVILKRVELARHVVKVAADIQCLPMDGGHPTVGGGRADPDELCALGEELYKLFAEHRHFNVARDGSGPFQKGVTEEETDCRGGYQEEGTDDQNGTKKSRVMESGNGQSFVLMDELGLPSALCFLISSLLDVKSSASESCNVYTSFKEVQEDLQLMARNPQKFLFPSVGALGCSQLQQLDIGPDAVYGREEELAKLQETYDKMMSTSRSGRGGRMVLISGYSGTGKSSLVHKAGLEYIKKGARFVSGKFDAMQQMQPLSAIIYALDEYCNLLAHDTGQIDHIRTAVAAALGSEGTFLLHLIPNLHKILPDIIDCQPAADVSGMELQHRLIFFVRMLFRVTCNSSSGVVLFLDDLQWADTSSLQLMRSLVTDSMLDKLLVIGCYRDNEVGPEHPLLECLNRIQRFGSAAVITMRTSNLDLASVSAFLSDALHTLPRATQSLSEAVLQKTGGNALFLKELLTSLRDEGLLRYSLSSRKWEWDIENIRARKIANNVVDLMREKLLRLAPEVHEALKVAAAFGSQCHEDIFKICDKDPSRLGSIVAALDIGVAEGLMVKLEGPIYRFSHDQIQSAAYMLIRESERESFHLRIGRCLWQQSSKEEMEEHLFVTVDQLHRGAGRISDHDEKIRLVKLSLVAAQKASCMSGFLPASSYLQSGIALIVDDDWKWHRELCFDLYNSCAEMEYILGKFNEVKVLLDEVIQRGRTLRETLRAYYTFVQSSGAQSNMSDAFGTAIMVLGELGESIPAEVTQSEVHKELMATHAVLQAKAEGDLLKLKTMTDIDKKEAMRFYNLLFLCAYNARKEHFPIMVCNMLQLSLSYGVCKESAIAFGAYGVLLCGMGDTAMGYRMGKISLTFLERFQAQEYAPRIFIGLYSFINDWTDPLQSSLPFLKSNMNVGLSVGDNEYAMLSAQFYQGTSLGSGTPLGTLNDEMNKHANQMIELNQMMIHSMNKPLRQFAQNLLGKSADPVKLIGDVMDEESMLDLSEKKGISSLRSVVYFYRMWLEVLFGEYERAADTGAKNTNISKENMSRFVLVANHAFYYGLAALVLARKQGRNKWNDVINMTMAQTKRWASSNPWNCQHKVELMNAEYAYLEGDIHAAGEAYDCAITSAAKHRFVHEEALALERAGIFYMENGDHETASGLFDRAHDCYIRWEAYSKAAHVRSYLQS